MNRMVWLSMVLAVMVCTSRVPAQERPPPIPGNEDDLTPNRAPIPDPSIFSMGPLTANAKGDAIQKLRVAQFNAAVRELKAEKSYFEAGVSNSNSVAAAAQRLIDVALALYVNPQEQVKWLERKLELMHFLEQVAIRRHEAGLANAIELAQAEYQRLGAEIELLKAKKRLGAESRVPRR